MTPRPKHTYRLAAILSQVHRFLYVLSNGRILSRQGNARFLLLTTRGRRSARMRTVPLLYVFHHGSPSVIASFGGNPQPPNWLANLQNDSKVMVKIGDMRREGVARIATEAEHVELWPGFVECFSGYEGYQARTTRRFSIVIITLAED